MTLREGRTFTGAETATTLLSSSTKPMARRLSPGASAIGKRLMINERFFS